MAAHILHELTWGLFGSCSDIVVTKELVLLIFDYHRSKHTDLPACRRISRAPHSMNKAVQVLLA